MDAGDRKRKRERKLKREARELKKLEARSEKLSRRASRPQHELWREPPKAKAPYRVNKPVARKMGLDLSGLNDAVSAFSAKGRDRMREAIANPLEHLEPAAVPLRSEPPKTPEPARPVDRQNQAREFAKKPDERKSPEVRDNKCKSRPKNNRSKIGGGGKKRFIPWC